MQDYRFEYQTDDYEDQILLKAVPYENVIPISRHLTLSRQPLEYLINPTSFEINAVRWKGSDDNFYDSHQRKFVFHHKLPETVFVYTDFKADPEFEAEYSPFEIDWDDYHVNSSTYFNQTNSDSSSNEPKKLQPPSLKARLKSRFQEKVDLVCSYYWKAFFKITELSHPE